MRVVVAEDVMLTREGITRLLTDSGIDVVGEVGDAAALLRAVRTTRPDAAIVDIRMPPTHTDEGLVAAKQIRAEHPRVGVLILSQYIEPHYAMRLLEQHPERVGYLLKERVFDVANLIDALRRLGDGETVVDPTIVARLFARKRRADPLEGLTEREREVLALIAEGLSNRAIAARLFVTERTVEAHVKQIFLKLGLATPTPIPTGACSPSSPICAAPPEPSPHKQASAVEPRCRRRALIPAKHAQQQRRTERTICMSSPFCVRRHSHRRRIGREGRIGSVLRSVIGSVAAVRRSVSVRR